MITTTVWRLGLSRSCKVADVACALPETLSHSHTHGPFDANDQTILPRFERRTHPVIGAFCATKQLRRIGPENRGHSRATATSKTARYWDPSSTADGSVCSHTQTEKYQPETRDAIR